MTTYLECAADNCTERFIRNAPQHRFHHPRCKDRQRRQDAKLADPIARSLKPLRRQPVQPDGLSSVPLGRNFRTAFIVNDMQYPFYDRALWEAACQIARDAEADTLLWDGDAIDFPQLSSFAHNPYKIRTAAQDVVGFHEEIREPMIEAVKDTLRDEYWNNGNHEYRYTRYCEHNAPAIGAHAEPRDFLRLPSGVAFAEYGKGVGTWLTPKLLVSHGWQSSKWSAYTAKANAFDMGNLSVICGHTHRVGVFMRTNPAGVQASYEVGHMADEESLPKAVEGVNDWQKVAGTIVRYEQGGDAFHVELIPLFGKRMHRCIANGREYTLDRAKGRSLISGEGVAA